MSKIWFDVEDMFDYAGLMSRPSGIQRLSFELYKAAHAMAPDRIGFFRQDRDRDIPAIVPFDQLWETYRTLVDAPVEKPSPDEPPGTWTPGGSAGGRRAAERPPVGLREPLVRAGAAFGLALRCLSLFALNVWRGVRIRLFRLKAMTAKPAPDGSPFQNATPLSEVAKPGDYVLAMGARWANPRYPEIVRRWRQENGYKFGLMVYDLIPLVRPEYCETNLTVALDRFLKAALPLCDLAFTISHATANDIGRWTARSGVAMRAPVEVLPIGTGFTPPQETPALPEGLADRGYVLFVSTIEARKNHALAFRAWRRLVDELPEAQVPVLVFAGRIGWIIDDLIEALRNCSFLDGKVRIVSDADDAMLAALYRGAQFTIFPSHYEGWGLPVSESLSYGRACIASSSTSVPEAGGEFCLYHDPDNTTEAFELYRRAITEPELVRDLERRIATEHRPTPWSAAAAAVLAAVDRGD